MGDNAIVIARSTARRSLSIGLGIGSRLPAYCSALGRLLLAALPAREAQERVQKMTLRALTRRTTTRVDAVLAHVEACRVDGYAVSDGELELVVRSMAMPVFNRSGTTIAALSIAVQAERMGLEVQAELPAGTAAGAGAAEGAAVRGLNRRARWLVATGLPLEGVLPLRRAWNRRTARLPSSPSAQRSTLPSRSSS
jgi:DNA-binding IclR family transcriptional regulator